jgi:hypothetical protein
MDTYTRRLEALANQLWTREDAGELVLALNATSAEQPAAGTDLLSEGDAYAVALPEHLGPDAPWDVYR